MKDLEVLALSKINKWRPLNFVIHMYCKKVIRDNVEVVWKEKKLQVGNLGRRLSE